MFQYHPLDSSHFNILFEWLKEPHVKAWWGPDENRRAFEIRHQSMIASPLVFPHIVFLDGRPIGYVNYWFVEEDSDFKPHFSKDTVGTDQFIGVPDLIGKGIGSCFIRQFTDELLLRPDVGLVITDPDPMNLPAIRSYEKAGFIKTKLMQTSEGEIQLMEKAIRAKDERVES